MSIPPLIFKVIGRAVVLPTMVVGLLALGVWFSSGNALSAGDARSPRKAPETTAPKTDDESQFIGTETCRKCHEKQYQKLKDRKMGMALFFNPRQPKLYVLNQESYPLTTSGEIGGLRKFDEAARVEGTAQALLQFDPTDKLSFSASYDTTQDKYRQTPYGLLDKDII